MRVVVLLDADHRAHAAEVGEAIMCDQAPYPLNAATTCAIGADVQLVRYVSGKGLTVIATLCRPCAEELGDGLRGALDILDAGQVSGWMRPAE